jgi:hypothetical protein
VPSTAANAIIPSKQSKAKDPLLRQVDRWGEFFTTVILILV